MPSARALGNELGALTGRLMTEAGVDLRTDVADQRFRRRRQAHRGGAGRRHPGGGRRGGGRDRRRAPPGVDRRDRPDGDGLACGPTGRVEGLPGVWAVGDIAAWADPMHGDRHRHEHWTSAVDQAATVASDILGEPPPPPTVPYFWSDQFGLKIQLFGRPEHADGLLPLHGDGLAGGAVKGTVVGMLAGDRLVAVAGFGAARFVGALPRAAPGRCGPRGRPGAGGDAHAPAGADPAAAPGPSAEESAQHRQDEDRAHGDEAVLDPGIGEPLLHGWRGPGPRTAWGWRAR